MSGLEVILAAVALGAAGPGIAVSLVQCSQFLLNKIKAATNLSKDIEQFEVFARDLKDGKLQTHWQLADRVSRQTDTDARIRQSFSDDLEHLKELLRRIDALLERVLGGRLRFDRFRIRNEIRNLSRDVEKWELEFVKSIFIYDVARRTLSEPLRLTLDKFSLISSGPNNPIRKVKGTNHVWLAHGEFLNADHTIVEMDVLIERRTPENFPASEDLTQVAALLSDLKPKDNTFNGILECLGYRQDPLELVFRVPAGWSSPQSLQVLLDQERGQTYGGGHSLDDRLRLAYQLAEAVLSVHLVGLVHKNIRANTVLLFQDGQSDTSSGTGLSDSIGVPMLSNWSLLRKATGVSTRSTDSTEWMEEIYKHPGRQSGGVQPAPRYNMGHDVYSLGVCLLEIGLWSPLITGMEMAANYKAMAASLGVQVQDTGKLAQPLGVQNILVALARQDLPPRMGTRFTELVVSCLTCLERGFPGDTNIFEADFTQVALGYRDAILLPLKNICL